MRSVLIRIVKCDTEKPILNDAADDGGIGFVKFGRGTARYPLGRNISL
jgi:hypothetical protein